MRKRLLSLGIVMCVVGVAFVIASNRLGPKSQLDQAFLESKIPPVVDGLSCVKSPADPTTLATLDPLGIITGVYYKASQPTFNVLLETGNKRESFHDPNVCLPSEGDTVSDEHYEVVQTKTRGLVRMRIGKMTPANSKDSTWVAYFYKVRNGFVARGGSIWVLTWAMFSGPLLHADFDMNTVFYRFIGNQPSTSKDEFLKFVADFLDTANGTSGGRI